MSLTATAGVGPQLLYPTSREFPFDEVCEQIVRALEERNWEVPGVTVDFDVYGTGEEKYRLVRYIKGTDFKLHFCRSQGRLGHWNDTAAVTGINIPKMELHVYEDESGPTLYAYVGKDWEKDKERFVNGLKVNSKLRGEERLYLQYEGSCNCKQTGVRHTHPGHRSPILVHTNDLGREYDLKRKDPKTYSTNQLFSQFTQWLEENLLAMILEQPVADEKTDYFQEVITPFPETIGPIFCFGENSDAERIHDGKLDINKLEPSDRYGFIGSGYRLMSFGTLNDGSAPDIAFDGFRWCGLGEVNDETTADTLEVPGHYRHADRECFVFRIQPNRADGIYVADHAPYEKRRIELFEQIKPRDLLTDAEVGEAVLARARTLVPISEYTGNYQEPVILINRELDFDEVELVSGPWPERKYILLIANRSDEARKLLEEAVSTREVYYNGFNQEARKSHNEAVKRLTEHFEKDPEFAQTVEVYSRFRLRKMDNAQVMERLVEAACQMSELELF